MIKVVCRRSFQKQILDLQMCKAGPSGVNNAPPEPFSPPFVPPLDGDADEYGLSNLHHSLHIAHCEEQVGLQQWGHDHVQQFIVEESDEEDVKTEKMTRLGIEPRPSWTYTSSSNQLSYQVLLGSSW